MAPEVKELRQLQTQRPSSHRRRPSKLPSSRPNPETLDILAAAYAELHRWDEALSTARQAHNLAVRAKQTQLAEAIRQRLALYREHRPYRAPSTVP